MGRFQNFDEIFSVLYVDFDNIYTRLLEQDAGVARVFATNPQRWLRWLEGHALRIMYGDGVRRRILKRCCYLNPHRYHEFRPYFIRSAFQVVDCPPLTSHGKTSADIYLVMDCMDALAHPTRFDEIIILSGDADFTPLLLRIQEYARRSLVLSVGYTSPAYASACSWRIREDWFITQALAEEQETGNGSGDRYPEKLDVPSKQNTYNAPSVPVEQQETIKKNLQLTATKRLQLIETIRAVVEESNVPVPLPSIAQLLQREQVIDPDWFGAGTLRDLLANLDLRPLVFSHAGQGVVYDPDRHDVPEEANMRDDFRQRFPELFEFAQKVHRLTDVPLLKPEHYQLVFKLLTEEVNTNGYSRIHTVGNIEDKCFDDGLPINGQQISFIADAVIRGGCFLGEEKGRLTVTTSASAFLTRTEELCKRSSMSVSEIEMQKLEQWLLATSG